MGSTNNVHVDMANNGSYEAEERAIEASLAIAYELRTQNLIAMTGMVNQTGSKMCDEGVLVDIANQIVSRMGLTNG